MAHAQMNVLPGRRPWRWRGPGFKQQAAGVTRRVYKHGSQPRSVERSRASNISDTRQIRVYLTALYKHGDFVVEWYSNCLVKIIFKLFEFGYRMYSRRIISEGPITHADGHDQSDPREYVGRPPDGPRATATTWWRTGVTTRQIPESRTSFIHTSSDRDYTWWRIGVTTHQIPESRTSSIRNSSIAPR